MDAIEITLAAAALVIGLTGTWSPCGFSMIGTIGPTGHVGGRRTTLAASATFVLGAVVGGVVTFGILSALGGLLHGASGGAAYLIAAAIAVAAAVAELRGAPIVPQLRRQLPEHWRRLMPMPLAAGLYGILLGLGFTTFVLSFGVWALAGIAVAVGELHAGLAIGIAFGIGRAAPIVLIAPIADKPIGIRAVELMALRPSIYRGFRFGDGLALLAAAAALAVGGTADAAKTFAPRGADPSARAGAVAFEVPGTGGVIDEGGARRELPGSDPAISDSYVAVAAGPGIRILDRESLAEVGTVAADGADAIALSDQWLAYRTRRDGRDSIIVVPISQPAGSPDATQAGAVQTGSKRRVAKAKRPSQLGRPAVDGSDVVFAVSHPRSNKIVWRDLGSGTGKVVLRDRTAALQNPSLRNRRLLYVRIDRKRQTLRLRPLSGTKQEGRKLIKRRRSHGTLWSTALDETRAYVTLLKGKRAKRAKLFSIPR